MSPTNNNLQGTPSTNNTRGKLHNLKQLKARHSNGKTILKLEPTSNAAMIPETITMQALRLQTNPTLH